MSTLACSYTNAKLTGANWDYYRGEPSYEACAAGKLIPWGCDDLKNKVDRCLYDIVRTAFANGGVPTEGLRLLQKAATLARLGGCGNCGEFSAVAFTFLHDAGVRPLDWMSLDGADHNFVVIGRQEGDAKNTSTWGPVAAVCDPWAQGFRRGDTSLGTYPASRFAEVMRRVTRYAGVSSLYRAA